MKLILEKINTIPRNLMRDCGYVEIKNPHKDDEISYVRSFDSGRFYPRFHIYLNLLSADRLEVNIHLDMKKPSYEGSSAHSGEYEGELVENESLRIKNIAKNFVSNQPINQKLGYAKEKSFWQKIFGK
ncbi:MAG: hypothetical protein PHN74_02865 [Candidatus Pacebacteria bacterium]|nr:hypothetical protein [Candidatus Paceibacterota bacterium]